MQTISEELYKKLVKATKMKNIFFYFLTLDIGLIIGKFNFTDSFI